MLLNLYRYEAYDFHRECKNMQWHKLNALIDKISNEQDQFSFFLMDRDKKLLSVQTGVFRTNCIDCLDRTNVVQSMIAWRSLSNILQVPNLIRFENNGFRFIFSNSLTTVYVYFDLKILIAFWSHKWEQRDPRRSQFLSVISTSVGWSRRPHFHSIFRNRSVKDGLYSNG